MSLSGLEVYILRCLAIPDASARSNETVARQELLLPINQNENQRESVLSIFSIRHTTQASDAASRSERMMKTHKDNS